MALRQTTALHSPRAYHADVGRRWMLGVLCIVLVTSGCDAGTLPVRSPAGTPAVTPHVTALPRLACGDGFGPPTQPSDQPTADHPVWSSSWNSGGGSTMTAADGTTWQSLKSPLTVDARSGGTVEIESPETARLAYVPATVWQSSPGDALLVEAGERRVDIPSCPSADLYPGVVMVPMPACVHLRITLHGRPPYVAAIPVGDASC
jgi:hypothetical protein